MVGGLHRTALATLTLGNYIIQNDNSEISRMPLYDLDKSSSLNSGIAVHIILPGSKQDLDEKFMKQAQHYSETVNNRKHKALEVPISGQIYELLKFKSNSDLDNLKYLPTKLIDDTQVCKTFKKAAFSYFEDCTITQQILLLSF
jgi:hypothetical protein